jgi:TP901 family phage tail tape measure protein
MSIKIRIVSDFDKKGFDNAESGLVKLGKTAGVALAAVGAATAAVAVKSVQEFAKFDSALTKSTAIMGDLTKAMEDDMARAAREVAKTTTFTAEQAAESFFFLASAGLDAEASIAALPRVAQFAQAGMFDMSRATDLLTDAQSALGLTIRDDAVANMENMIKVSDVLVRANTLSNATVEQFSTSLTTKAGPALRTLGKDMEEGVAVLAAFADQGIKGEEAGTQLSIVLRDLSTKAIKNKDDFAQFGVSVFDANGEMRNLGDIVANLETALDGMSDETAKATLLQMGFADRSVQSILALLGTSDAIKEYETSLRSASGFTDQVANKQLESFESQMLLLQSAIADVGIEIGYELVPVLKDMIPYIIELAEDIGPDIVSFFEFWADVIKLAMTEGTDLNEALRELSGAFDLLGDAMSGGKGDAEGFTETLSNLVYVLEWIVTTFAALIAGLQGFGHAFEALLRGDFQEFWRFLTTDTLVYVDSLNEVETQLDNVGREGVTAYGHLASLNNISLTSIQRRLIETANAARALFVNTTFTGTGGTKEWLDNMFGTGSAKTETEKAVLGFTEALNKGAASATNTAREQVQRLVKNSQKQLADAQEQYNKTVDQANESYASNVERLQREYANRLEGIIQQSQQRLNDAYKSAVAVNISSLFERDENKSVEGLVKSLSDKLTASRNLLSNSAELASAGFSQTFIEQIVSAGTETGNELASAILDSTPEVQRELQELFRALEIESTQGMDALAESIYEKQGLATDELKELYAQTGNDLIEALENQQIILDQALLDANNKFAESVQTIKEKVLDDISEMEGGLGGLGGTVDMFIGKLDNLIAKYGEATEAMKIPTAPAPSPAPSGVAVVAVVLHR